MSVRIYVDAARACFTQPALRAERCSYPVMTPSAAVGLIENVYWKPAVRWVCDRIVVLNPIAYKTITRNEVDAKLPAALLAGDMDRGELRRVDAVALHQQRSMAYLTDVAYVVTYHMERVPGASDGSPVGKHLAIARRRLERGQYFSQPYMGVREFAVGHLRPLRSGDAVPESFYTGVSVDLGPMLYGLDYGFGGRPTPTYFLARMVDGAIDLAAARKEGLIR